MKTCQSSILFGCLLLLLQAVGQSAQANEDVDYWLDRMVRAIESLNYRGTLVHMREGHVDTLHIVHRVDADGIRERIASVDGPQREVLRDGQQVRVLLGADQSMVFEGGIGSRLLPKLPADRQSQPILAYRMSFVGSERVAGKDTRVLEMRPRDQFRYGHRFWLEEQTGMLLRSALLDHEGNYLQHLSFVSIELDVPISASELEPELRVSDALEIRMAAIDGAVDDVGELDLSEAPRPTWTPRLLPDGFRMVSVSRGLNSEGQEFEHQLFSDGLASFSVYIKAAVSGESAGKRERIDAVGPVHLFTGMVEDHRVTVVGEVPSATVAFVAQQLQRQELDGESG